jgi:hypothetical protein
MALHQMHAAPELWLMIVTLTYNIQLYVGSVIALLLGY